MGWRVSDGCGVGRGGLARGAVGDRRGMSMVFYGQPPPGRTGRSQKMVFLLIYTGTRKPISTAGAEKCHFTKGLT